MRRGLLIALAAVVVVGSAAVAYDLLMGEDEDCFAVTTLDYTLGSGVPSAEAALAGFAATGEAPSVDPGAYGLAASSDDEVTYRYQGATVTVTRGPAGWVVSSVTGPCTP